MHIRDYQQWLVEWDSLRGWDRVLPSHTMLHAVEEMGEVSRLVQMLEGYRDMDEKTVQQVQSELELEFSDLQVMLFKLAYQCGIDLESAMIRGQEKADERFPDIAESVAERASYWRRFKRYVEENRLDEE